jgi:putative ABC transport system permease protein
VNISEGFSTAFASIRVNKLRSALTMLGIIIGVASVIALTSIGAGFSGLVNRQIQASGSSLITVSGTTSAGYPSLTMTDAASLLNADAAPSVQDVAMKAQITANVEADEARRRTTVTGVSSNFFTLDQSLELAEGAFFTDDSAQSALLGAEIAEALFPNKDALNSTVTIDGQPFEVTGVLAPVEAGAVPLPPGADRSMLANILPNENNVIYVPLAAAQTTLAMPISESGDPALTSLVVMANPNVSNSTANAEIRAALREAHGLAEDDQSDFTIRSSAALADNLAVITAALTGFLGAIAGISLVVGGIGIMNIMLVSVTERTREIGIRKAMGALDRDILAQFIIEAVVLCVTGGIIGMLLGWIIAFGGGSLLGLTVVPNIRMVILAVTFSSLVGLIFGVYPAWKASRLAPIVALRYE